MNYRQEKFLSIWDLFLDSDIVVVNAFTKYFSFISIFLFPCFIHANQPSEPLIHAQTPHVDEIEAPPRIHEKKLSFLDRQRVFITNQFVDLSESLDRIISNKPTDGKNKSYMVLDFDSVFEEGGQRSFNLRARAKIDLPNTKHRFKLILESDPEYDFSPQENELAGITADDKLEPDRAVAAVEYTKYRNQYEWQPSFDVGTRFEFPLDLFTRMRLQKMSKFGRHWHLFSKLDFPYYAREGARPSARLSFERSLSSSFLFKSVSRYKYTEKQNIHETYQSFQLNQVWNEHQAMEYKVGAFGNSETDHPIDHYFIQFVFKKRLYRNWMYISFIPQVIFPYAEDWSPENAFTITLQSVFAK